MTKYIILVEQTDGTKAIIRNLSESTSLSSSLQFETKEDAQSFAERQGYKKYTVRAA